MSRRSRKDADEAFLMNLACGATVENAAQKAGISRRTAYRRWADPAFRQRLTALRADMFERNSGFLTAAALESTKTLVSLQAPENPPKIRLAAAQSVLDKNLKYREASDEKRMTALEQRVDALAGT